MKEWASNPKRAELQAQQMHTLGLGNFADAVKLPVGEDINEWYAVNVVNFFNQISMLYTTIIDFCTEQKCPIMSAGPAYKYLWSDKKHPKPVMLSAPEYIGNLMDWIESLFDDNSIFPSTIGDPFPKNFHNIIKDIMKRLFRVYAHCYYHHLENFEQLEVTPHVNTSFKHFIFFALEFKLIPSEQLEPLRDVIDSMVQSTKPSK